MARKNVVRRAAGSKRVASSTPADPHWSDLFEGLDQGFMVGQALRDKRGKVTDWRLLVGNQAFFDIIGLPKAEIVGRTIRDFAPLVEQSWIEFTAGVVNGDQPVNFSDFVAHTKRHFEGRTFPIGGDQFASIFLDTTDRVTAERHQLALIAIGDQLRDLDRFEDMARATARILGETLRVIRVGFGRLDPKSETVTIDAEWAAPDRASVIGTHRFADYGDILDDLLKGAPLVIDDVRSDPRTRRDPQPMLALDIGAQVNMPLRERERTAAIFFVHHSKPRVWTDQELAFLRNVADRIELVVDRLEVETQRVLQAQELSHRVKNTLAMVQAIASQTLKPVTERAAVANFERRLSALATAHEILLGSEWEPAPLDDLIGSVLDSIGQEGRVGRNGPRIELSPRAVLSASLLIHELATNAAKYGAVSSSTGTVTVEWAIREQDGQSLLTLEWTERGGPPAKAPTRRGFGSRLINMGLVGTGGVELDYGEAGLTARMSAPVDDLTKD